MSTVADDLDALRTWFPLWRISEDPGDGRLTAVSEGRDPKVARSPEELRVMLLDEQWRGTEGKGGSL